MGAGPGRRAGKQRRPGTHLRWPVGAADAPHRWRPAGRRLVAAPRRERLDVATLGRPGGDDDDGAAEQLVRDPAVPGQRAGPAARPRQHRSMAGLFLSGQRLGQLPVDGQCRHGSVGTCRHPRGPGAALGGAPGALLRRRHRPGRQPRPRHADRAMTPMRPRRGSRPAQAGAALLTAMVIVALIATLATSMIWQQWRAVQVEAAERSRVQSAWILSGALDWARLILREDARNGGTDDLGEPWAVPLAE